MAKTIAQYTTLDWALDYLRAGVSIIPIRRDGSKAPALPSWKEFQERYATEDEVVDWFEVPNPPGIAAVCGQISRSLMLVDFDQDAIRNLREFCGLLGAEKPGLFESLTVHRTPRQPNGYHIWLLAPIPSLCLSGKVAMRPAPERDEVLIETKGQGGYGLLPGSPPECHPSKLPYSHFAGPTFPPVTKLTLDQFDLVLSAARCLNRKPTAESPVPPTPTGPRAGDEFNEKGWEWSRILQPHGWVPVREADGITFWARPGKHGVGWSATTGMRDSKNGHELLCVHSSNAAPFESGKSYGKFRAYAALNHQGNLSLAAKDLANRGFGTPPPSAQPALRVLPVPAPAISPHDDSELDDRDLLSHIADQAGLFRTPAKVPFARIKMPSADGDFWQIIPFEGEGVREWLVLNFFQRRGYAPRRDPLSETLSTMQARAKHMGAVEPVYLRTAPLKNGGLVLDLAQQSGKCVVLTAESWKIEGTAPVNFIRPDPMLPLPDPVEGGNMGWLWELLNIRPEDRVLVAAWLLSALNPSCPYPMLCVHGEAGAGKTLATQFLRTIIDPLDGDSRRPPQDETDLAIMANNSWVCALENLSRIDADMSDAFCAVLTGTSLTARKKYTNWGETSIKLRRPMILNGIPEVTNAPDLASRSILVTCPKLDDKHRHKEEELKARFRQAHPGILGALLTSYSGALRRIPDLPPFAKTRLADFEELAVAGEEEMGFQAGTFLSAFHKSRNANAESLIEASNLAQALLKFLEKQNTHEYEGNASTLLNNLESQNPELKKSKSWPGSPHSLSQQLRRLEPPLRARGITIERFRDSSTTGNRILRIKSSQ